MTKRRYIELRRCDCGRTPAMCNVRAAEDAVATWVECACGWATEQVEDAYSDPATAGWLWNTRRDLIKHDMDAAILKTGATP